MILTSDGRVFVFGLFGADGCECENLEAVFDSQSAADARKAEIQSSSVIRHSVTGREWKSSHECYGDPDLLEVRMLEVNRGAASPPVAPKEKL